MCKVMCHESLLWAVVRIFSMAIERQAEEHKELHSIPPHQPCFGEIARTAQRACVPVPRRRQTDMLARERWKPRFRRSTFNDGGNDGPVRLFHHLSVQHRDISQREGVRPLNVDCVGSCCATTPSPKYFTGKEKLRNRRLENIH